MVPNFPTIAVDYGVTGPYRFLVTAQTNNALPGKIAAWECQGDCDDAAEWGNLCTPALSTKPSAYSLSRASGAENPPRQTHRAV